MTRPVTMSTLLDMLRQRDKARPTENEKVIYRAFVKLWPNARRALTSFIRNPSCGSCRADLTEYLVGDASKVLAFLKEVDPDEQWDLRPFSSQQTSHQQQAPRIPSVTMRGQCRDIKDTPEAYADLMDELKRENARYAGLAVRPLAKDMVRIYFY